MDSWLDSELNGCAFKDQRLGNRFKQIMQKLAGGSGKSIPEACEEWSSAKATYRFLSNERIEESEILAGHFAVTGSRINATDGPVLVVHDTCEFSFKRTNPETVGLTMKGFIRVRFPQDYLKIIAYAAYFCMPAYALPLKGCH